MNIIRPQPLHASINDYSVWPMEAIDSEIELLFYAKLSKQGAGAFEQDVNAILVNVLAKDE